MWSSDPRQLTHLLLRLLLMMLPIRRAALVLSIVCAGFSPDIVQADPLSRRFEVDFYRDVPSRELRGLAARSDGRLIAGPVLTQLEGELNADLLWCLEPDGNGGWFLGTGPSGRILRVTIDEAAHRFDSSEFAALDESQILALRRLPDGRLLAGTSPQGRLYLLNGDGSTLSQVTLPVDSVLDLQLIDNDTVLVATGNPGRIYRVDLAQLASAGLAPTAPADAVELESKGVTLFGEVRDRNIRQIAVLGDRLIAGSAPKGNLYAFSLAATGENSPVLLQENRDAEVTDLLPLPNGDFFAALVFGGNPTESRVTRPATADRPAELAPDPGTVDRFSGRASLVYFPADGHPEVVAGRNNSAFYQLAMRDGTVLIAGGEQGELFGYQVAERRSLNFAGSAAAQLNSLVPVDEAGRTFLLAGNNAPQLALLEFETQAPRRAETRRLDLGGLTELGNLRFNRLRSVAPAELTVSLRASNGTDELEGWTSWTEASPRDGAWYSENLRGRYAKLRIEVPAAASNALQIDRASLYHLPQNRRPQLQDFRLIAPHFGLLVRGDSSTPPTVTLGQLTGTARIETETALQRRASAVLASPVVRQPGTQIAYWNVADPDGDSLAATFSIRPENDERWIDLAVDTTDSYAQFDFSHLSDGVYFTRLVVTEQAPREPEARLSVTFETDDLVIDKTAPEILESATSRAEGMLMVTVLGRDQRSLLAGIELVFNNGLKEVIEQPADGILDGHEETFTAEFLLQRIAGATSVEILLYDALGNSAGRRLELR